MALYDRICINALIRPDQSTILRPRVAMIRGVDGAGLHAVGVDCQARVER